MAALTPKFSEAASNKVKEVKEGKDKHGGSGGGDDSLTNTFNTAARNRPEPPAATRTERGTVGGAASAQADGPGINSIPTGTTETGEDDESVSEKQEKKISIRRKGRSRRSNCGS
jgi:hypothetical protein